MFYPHVDDRVARDGRSETECRGFEWSLGQPATGKNSLSTQQLMGKVVWKDKAEKERGGLRLQYAVSKRRWASSLTATRPLSSWDKHACLKPWVLWVLGA